MKIDTKFSPGDRVRISDIQQEAVIRSVTFEVHGLPHRYCVTYWHDCVLKTVDLWEGELQEWEVKS